MRVCKGCFSFLSFFFFNTFRGCFSGLSKLILYIVKHIRISALLLAFLVKSSYTQPLQRHQVIQPPFREEISQIHSLKPRMIFFHYLQPRVSEKALSTASVEVGTDLYLCLGPSAQSVTLTSVLCLPAPRCSHTSALCPFHPEQTRRQ